MICVRPDVLYAEPISDMKYGKKKLLSVIQPDISHIPKANVYSHFSLYPSFYFVHKRTLARLSDQDKVLQKHTWDHEAGKRLPQYRKLGD